MTTKRKEPAVRRWRTSSKLVVGSMHAYKLKNLRILRITFKTFRHWKGTMEYHRTKDIVHVKQVLGHKKHQQH